MRKLDIYKAPTGRLWILFISSSGNGFCCPLVLCIGPLWRLITND